jgi:5-formyltetrahydrofolate cyclo-ligase
VGKGGGYSEVEYGILRELDLLSESTPVITTVHDLQLVKGVPVDEHDFMVDVIITPTKVIRTNRSRPQPSGILWDKVTPEMLDSMPILRELKDRTRSKRS